MAPNWRRLLTSAIRGEELKAVRVHERTGRPLGDENLLALLEQYLGRILRRQKPGPKNVQAR
jgi:putative transposase